ncbi:hypothetical protein RJT34_17927 [Clitoria ternatea]|uniref:Uncharacterized protein n=1 Tax=Clitoria ternatea TaxID=43366 RepID=A0AAN9PEY2_CLITE
MASFAALHGLHDSLLRSQFLGQDHHHHHHPLKQPPSTTTVHHRRPTQDQVLKPCAKFNIFEMMGGRGLCNGEKGLQIELKRQVLDAADSKASSSEAVAAKSSGKEEENGSGSGGDDGVVAVPEDGFEKEMMGLTGGFPGGEKGLIKFIEKNPPNVVTLSL